MGRAARARMPKSPPRYPPLEVRLAARLVARPGTGCIEWTGSVDGGGYGHIRRGSGLAKCHIVAWELQRGAVPDGLELDHLCVNPKCCNVDHLEPVTHAENMRRARERRSAANK